MSNLFADQIAARALRGTVSICLVRDPRDGTFKHGVRYQHAGEDWISRCQFIDVDMANAAALTLSDYLGAEYRA